MDVAIVGGGPCGSYAAYTAARFGSDVTVFEEDPEIGYPTHCAGHLSLNGLKRFNINLPSKIIENKISGITFHSPSGKTFETQFNSPVTIVVNRRAFDSYVAKLAVKTGVKYRLNAKVFSLLKQAGKVSGIVVRENGELNKVQAKVVIDAEGCPSTLLRKIGFPTVNRQMVVNAVHAEVDRVEQVPDNQVEVYLGREYAEGFYAWIIPKKDGSAKVGLAVKTGNPRKTLKKFMQKHAVASSKLKRSEITEVCYHPISLGGSISKTYGDGLLIVGDAASQVKPTTGGGVVFGMLCSRIAGTVAHEATVKNDFSARFLSKYQKEWKRMISFDMRIMLQIRKMLNQLSDKSIDSILELCHFLRIDKTIRGVQDLDFQGKSLMRLILHPSLHLVALNFMLRYLTSQSKALNIL